MSPRPSLRCPVRGCGLELVTGERSARCARGHSFDRARSGYWNLLQPQDSRARQPGDDRETALARRRLFERGLQTPLVEAILAELATTYPKSAVPLALLDVGCGEGSLLAALGAREALNLCGVDLSAASLELAARRLPAATWVVANADRGIPWIDGSFDVVLSVAARRNAGEFLRMLAPGGHVLLAVAAADDLQELRAAMHGAADAPDRAAAALAELEAGFALARRARVRHRARFDRQGLDDLLASSYRGARNAARAKLAGVDGLEVTMSWDLLTLVPRGA